MAGVCLDLPLVQRLREEETPEQQAEKLWSGGEGRLRHAWSPEAERDQGPSVGVRRSPWGRQSGSVWGISGEGLKEAGIKFWSEYRSVETSPQAVSDHCGAARPQGSCVRPGLPVPPCRQHVLAQRAERDLLGARIQRVLRGPAGPLQDDVCLRPRDDAGLPG